MSKIIDARRQVVATLKAADKTSAEIAQELDVHPVTIRRDFIANKAEGLQLATSESRIELAVEMDKIKFELEDYRERVKEIKDTKEYIKLSLQIMDRWQSLLSMNLVKKSVRTNVNVEADPSQMKLWQRAVYELRHIPEDKLPVFWSRVQPVIADLEQREIVLDGSYFPTKAAITGGDDESN